MSTADMKANRPLSPHLQVYRWPITMAVSIGHRVTGMGLYFGMAIFAWWLTAAAAGEAYFSFVTGIIDSWPGRVILFLATWALLQHLIGGLRHFVWDFGKALGKPARDQIAWANIIAAVILTLIVWAIGLALT